MRKNVKTMAELKDSRLMFDKNLPAFGYFLIVIVAVFLILALALSMKVPKVYTIQAQGTVTSVDANYVMSTYTGQIDECNLVEGAVVKQGDLLFTVKSTDYDLQKQQLVATREAYAKQVEKYGLLVKSIKDDKNYFDATSAEDELYYSTFERYKSQVAQNTVDVSMYKMYGYTDAQIEAEFIKNQSKIMEVYYTAIQSAEGSKKEYELQVASIDAQLAAVESGQGAYGVQATASGVLHLLENYKSGMVVQTTTAVATITPENSAKVIETYVSTADMARMNVGDDVQIVIDGLSQTVYGSASGKVLSIDSNVTSRQNQGGSYYQAFKVLIELDNEYLISSSGDKVDIVNGMTAQARIQYDRVTYLNYVLEKLGFKVG